MALRESNQDNILTDLNNVLGLRYIRISYDVSIEDNNSFWDPGLGFKGSATYASGPPTVDLYIRMFINDLTLAEAKKDIFTEIEAKISDMLHEVDGVFMKRTVQPFRDQKAYQMDYTIRLRDYDNFKEKLHQYALTQLDKEFREVLEAKLTDA